MKNFSKLTAVLAGCLIGTWIGVAQFGCTTSKSTTTTPGPNGSSTTTTTSSSTINSNDVAAVQALISNGVTDAAVIAATVNSIRGATNK